MKFNITLQDIRDKGPCYDPEKYLSENWSGTLLDVLDIKECPFDHRLWVVTHFLCDKLNRLFAVYCARQALTLIENPDERSIKACEVAEKFALGLATEAELDAAWAAARDAAWAAADAAWAAAADAAWAAARAARDAASDAAWAARDARDAARDDFEAYLRLLIKDEIGALK